MNHAKSNILQASQCAYAHIISTLLDFFSSRGCEMSMLSRKQIYMPELRQEYIGR